MKPDFSEPAEEKIQTESQSIEQSIPEQILSEMLTRLKEKSEFPLEILDQIKKLGDRNQLQKATEVSKVVKSPAGGPHAAA